MGFQFFVLPSGFVGFAVLAAALAILAGTVIARRPRTKASVLFFGTIIWLITWVASKYFGQVTADESLAMIFLRMDFVATIFFAYFFFAFASNFPRPRPATKIERVLAGIALAFSAFAFTDLLVKNVSFSQGVFAYNFGWFYGLYATYLFLGVGGAIVRLVQKARELTAEERIQVSYVLAGIGLTAATSLAFSVLLADRISPEISRFGLYGVLFFVGFTTIAVIKHQLTNIEVIATEALVTGITIVLALETFLSVTTTEFLFRSVFFWLVAVFGFMLVRSALEAAKRRIEADLFRRQLDELQRRFHRLESARSEFISIASHQLRTPLTIIRGYLSLVLEGTYAGQSEKGIEVMTRAYAQAEDMIRLIDHLLSISNLESGTVQYEFAAVRLDQLARTIAGEFEPQARKKNLYLKLDVDEGAAGAAARIDEKKIALVLRNLIDNAVKYTPRGGVTVRISRRKKELVVSVKDTGLGMTPDDIAQCFQKLSRGETVKADFPVGTGLGLFISKKYVAAHGGKIWAASGGPGRGSEFVFTLPVGK